MREPFEIGAGQTGEEVRGPKEISNAQYPMVVKHDPRQSRLRAIGRAVVYRD